MLPFSGLLRCPPFPASGPSPPPVPGLRHRPFLSCHAALASPSNCLPPALIFPSACSHFAIQQHCRHPSLRALFL
eukprot:5694850-Prorocentrum_lima.AAC.1